MPPRPKTAKLSQNPLKFKNKGDRPLIFPVCPGLLRLRPLRHGGYGYFRRQGLICSLHHSRGRRWRFFSSITDLLRNEAK